ncbi:MAG: hypothetical protein JWN13_1532 [Betaproteobacteria bacterium]|jgi:hypothetical protein|nr:hypothetical protein [Betaproteobacteria bacterium]
MRFYFDMQREPPQRWIWRCIDPDTDSVLKMSQASFATLYACIKDAELNGYVSPVSQAHLSTA